MNASRALVPPGRWVVDPEASVVGFSVRHLAVATVRGRFTRFEGWIEADESGHARAGGSVDVASIETRMEARDARLRSSDCFDAEHHPVFRFEGTAPAGDGRLEIVGDLTIMGRTRPLRLLPSPVSSAPIRSGSARAASSGGASSGCAGATSSRPAERS